MRYFLKKDLPTIKAGTEMMRGKGISLSIKDLVRFVKKIKEVNGCWEWQGALSGYCGYGQFKLNHKIIRAHRLSYEFLIKKIESNKVLDHLCRNPKCVNPSHLEMVTQKENILRGVSPSAKNAVKTHCPQGHPYRGKNLLLEGKGTIRRCSKCRKPQCKKASAKFWKNKSALALRMLEAVKE